MRLVNKSPAIKVEWEKILKQEKQFIEKRIEKKPFLLNQKLEEKLPEKLEETLEGAFEKAFTLVFNKGTTIIEKTYKRDEIEKTYNVQQFEVELRKNKKSLNAMKKEAVRTGIGNLILSGASGVGMGILGIGLPDVPIFIAILLKNVYEIALHYGFKYDTQDEQYFILLMIEGANSYGEDLKQINSKINHYCQYGEFSAKLSIREQIKKTAKTLSSELIYMKFLQGIPIIGAVGGAYDIVCLQKVNEYAKLKYQYRYLFNQKVKVKG